MGALKIPLNPPFSKGEHTLSSLWQRGNPHSPPFGIKGRWGGISRAIFFVGYWNLLGPALADLEFGHWLLAIIWSLEFGDWLLPLKFGYWNFP